MGSQMWHETSEEGQRMHWQKCCEYINEDENNSPNTLSDNKKKTILKFKIHLVIIWH